MVVSKSKNISHWNINVKEFIEFLRDIDLSYTSHHPSYNEPTIIHPYILSQAENSGVACRQWIIINLIENDEITTQKISSTNYNILIDIPKEAQEYLVVSVGHLFFEEYYFKNQYGSTYRNGTRTTLSINCKKNPKI